MFDTFPGVGDWTADKLTLNYKHFVQCQRQMKDLLFSLQSNSASTKIYMVQNYFICCAGNINERMYMHVYHVCIFMAKTSSQSNTACLEASTIDQENRRVCFSVVRKPNKHGVISPLCVPWEDFSEARSGNKEMEKCPSP